MAEAQQQRTIILSGDDLDQFETVLETIPHGTAKKLINIINKAQRTRLAEEKRNAETVALQKRLYETLSEIEALKNPGE